MTVPSYDHDFDTDFHLFLSTDDGSKPVTSMQISPEPHAFVAVGEVGGCTKVIVASLIEWVMFSSRVFDRSTNAKAHST